MHKLKNFIVFSLFCLFIVDQAYTSDQPPVKPKKLLIQDGEQLKYGNFVGGERYQDINLVSRLSEDQNKVYVYIGKYNIGSKLLMPKHYTNYQRQFTVSLESASLISGFGDYVQQSLEENTTGEVAFRINIDAVKNMAVYASDIWDGYEMRTKTTRVKLVPGYPVWDVPSVAFIGSRYLDLSGSGIIYGVYPTVVKEAVPVNVRMIKKEVLNTPLGKINTTKFGIGVTDQFLSQLLESYIKELYIWIEDAPRGLVIKTQSPTESYILEGISTWKD